jgi:hypothetical protein
LKFNIFINLDLYRGQEKSQNNSQEQEAANGDLPENYYNHYPQESTSNEEEEQEIEQQIMPTANNPMRGLPEIFKIFKKINFFFCID